MQLESVLMKSEQSVVAPLAESHTHRSTAPNGKPKAHAFLAKTINELEDASKRIVAGVTEQLVTRYSVECHRQCYSA